jgi:hypothetical protein
MSSTCEACGRYKYEHEVREVRIETRAFTAKRRLCTDCDEVLTTLVREHLKIPRDPHARTEWQSGTFTQLEPKQ